MAISVARNGELIPKGPLTDLRRGFPRGEISPWCGRFRSDAVSGEIARRLFGGRASHARSPVKDVSQTHRLRRGLRLRWNDRVAAAKIGGMDRQTLRDWVHRFNASGPEGLIDNRTEGPSLACRRNSWLSLRRSWKAAWTVRKMASFGGGASISSVSLPKGSASIFISAMLESSGRSLASPISAPDRVIRLRTSGSSRGFEKTSRVR